MLLDPKPPAYLCSPAGFLRSPAPATVRLRIRNGTIDESYDCGKDDYYYPGTAPAGNYLHDHWNIADSGFLTPIGTAGG